MRAIARLFSVFLLANLVVPLAGSQARPQTPQSSKSSGLSETTVSIDGVAAALLRNSHPRGSLILLSGGGGHIGVGENGSIARTANQLVRTRRAYARLGFAVFVPDCCVNVAAAVHFMRAFGRVTLVGTSRGTQRAARGIAEGARPDRLVLTSGFLSDASGESDNVVTMLGSPSRLPPTLVVHHRQDHCRVTRPAGVRPFLDWARGKARVVWLSGGVEKGRPCGSSAYHGFHGIDDRVVAVISRFAAR